MSLDNLLSLGWDTNIVGRELNFAVVTDSKFAGGADPTGTTDPTNAINAAISSLTSGGIVFLPAGTIAKPTYYKCGGQLAYSSGVTIMSTAVVTSGSALSCILQSTRTDGQSFITANGASGIKLANLAVLNFNAAYSGTLVDFGGQNTALSELDQVYLQQASGSVGDLLHLDQATYHLSRKCNFANGRNAVLGKATQGSYTNGVQFQGCRFQGQSSASIRNAGQAWEVTGGAAEAGNNGQGIFYRHDAGVTADNFAIRSVWFGDITANGPNTTIAWSGNNLAIRDSFCGFNDGAFVTVDENNCSGIVMDNNKYDAFNTHNPTYAIDFGTTTGHSNFQGLTNPTFPRALTANVHGNAPIALLPPQSADPRLLNTATAFVANQAHYYRVQGAGYITKIAVHIGTASGNVCVGVYKNNGFQGQAARPAAQSATSGSVACPVAGYAEIALTSGVYVEQGDWLAFAADNAVGTLYKTSGPVGFATALGDGQTHFQGTAFPLPATAAPSGSSSAFSEILVGKP